MNTKVITVTFEMTIEQVMNLFIKNEISGAPIVEKSKTKLISLVSEADLLRFAAMDSLQCQLIQFINRLPDLKTMHTAHPEDPFSKVYEEFLKTPFRRIPIVDGEGNVQGIVSRRDIMSGFLRCQ